jgi:hypothetical protein
LPLWSELQPWEWRDALTSVHPDLDEDFLIAAGMAVPELAPRIAKQKSKEDKVRVCLRYFGDEQHSQPTEGGALAPSIFNVMDPGGPGWDERLRPPPRWGRLPPLDDLVTVTSPSTRVGNGRSKLGRRDKDVSVLEANRVARIYEDDSADDSTSYAVHKSYVEELADEGIEYDAKAGDSPHLSRPMVAYLMNAIANGWLPWDSVRKSLAISDEFRTRRGRFLIPRRDPARKAKI